MSYYTYAAPRNQWSKAVFAGIEVFYDIDGKPSGYRCEICKKPTDSTRYFCSDECSTLLSMMDQDENRIYTPREGAFNAKNTQKDKG